MIRTLGETLTMPLSVGPVVANRQPILALAVPPVIRHSDESACGAGSLVHRADHAGLLASRLGRDGWRRSGPGIAIAAKDVCTERTYCLSMSRRARVGSNTPDGVAALARRADSPPSSTVSLSGDIRCATRTL
jgi:hypothetical protein